MIRNQSHKTAAAAFGDRFEIRSIVTTATIAMSLEAARKFSIPELLRVLNEKVSLEYSRVREIPPPLGVPAGSLGPEVCT